MFNFPPWPPNSADPTTQNPETSRLLYDDPYRAHYGTNSSNVQRVIQQQPDPEILRQEREEMDRICHQMSA